MTPFFARRLRALRGSAFPTARRTQPVRQAYHGPRNRSRRSSLFAKQSSPNKEITCLQSLTFRMATCPAFQSRNVCLDIGKDCGNRTAGDRLSIEAKHRPRRVHPLVPDVLLNPATRPGVLPHAFYVQAGIARSSILKRRVRENAENEDSGLLVAGNVDFAFGRHCVAHFFSE